MRAQDWPICALCGDALLGLPATIAVGLDQPSPVCTDTLSCRVRGIRRIRLLEDEAGRLRRILDPDA